MKPGKYTIRELFINKSIQQIIIPEIQRDYVWSPNEVRSLLSSIQDFFKKYKEGFTVSELYEDKEIQESFEQFIKKEKFSCNIGFIYAYTDSDYSGRYFLIDGQQRLSTLYLLLLVLSRRIQSFRQDFDRIYCKDAKPSIDYRVRDTSKDFLHKLIISYEKNMCITNQIWYIKEYDYDKTITSIITNLNCIEKFLDKPEFTTPEFLDYVQNYTNFWYFDTNISSQGEELYIFMNARGEQTQENENLKADLLEQLPSHDKKLKAYWGKEWENWQDFFWKHRGKNKNADIGFNEFINCIAGAENFFNNYQIVYTKSKYDKGIIYSDIKKCLGKDGLEIIMRYVKALTYLLSDTEFNEIQNKYPNSKWFISLQWDILSLFNRNNTNWLADINDENRGLEICRMVFAWSTLYYLIKALNQKTNKETIFRVLRFFYVRYMNYNRSIKNIKDLVDDIFKKDLFSDHGTYETEEEKHKHKFLSSIHSDEELYKYEDLIWAIEDHPINIKGRDLNAINCSHLVDFHKNQSLIELENIRTTFYSLFPVDDNGRETNVNKLKLVTLLLFYGYEGERDSPWYCWNFNFGNFARIVRGLGDPRKSFKQLFSDLLNSNFDTLYMQKVSYPYDSSTKSFIVALKWYASKLKEKTWSNGFYIVHTHDKFPSNDKFFPNLRQLVNSKGTVRGYNPRVLADLIDKGGTS